ncbi:hypothetical protein ACJ73_03961 [Blastomyces percursus]|uniref:Uncharacterized protein n=1 Tax=Blastomyces percursus TaxID=1658174 RepID=A0A1J9Q821_9EURO|nr:hypothetical protein ACJ73_03961 [Blastomyces percursus]
MPSDGEHCNVDYLDDGPAIQATLRNPGRGRRDIRLNLVVDKVNCMQVNAFGAFERESDKKDGKEKGIDDARGCWLCDE